ncbi:hypothetical protein MMC19_002128 [Ptychographa xylographoides]|nr:hypothetical protein [Ptychographa xylographoides]
MTFTLVYSSLYAAYAQLGGCRHVQHLTLNQTTQATGINWLNQPFTVLAIATSKVSVALLILRLQGPCKWRAYLLYFLAASIWTYAAAIIVVVFTQCRPSYALWTEQEDSSCMQAEYFVYIGYSSAGYAAFQVLALAIIPMTFILKLQLSLHKRLSLCLVLGVGIFASACAIVKTTKLSEDGSLADFIWDTLPIFIWTANEVNIIIIGACIPAVYPLVSSYIEKHYASHGLG